MQMIEEKNTGEKLMKLEVANGCARAGLIGGKTLAGKFLGMIAVGRGNPYLGVEIYVTVTNDKKPGTRMEGKPTVVTLRRHRIQVLSVTQFILYIFHT